MWGRIGGHSMNVGLQDTHNLAWKLAAVQRGEAKEILLDTYSEEQREMARAVIREMKLNVLERPNPPTLVRALKVLMPLALDAVQGGIEFALSDLGMHRRRSQLSRQCASTRPLRAGDRAPNVAVVADGRHTDLHRLLSYEHWTLLLRPGRGDSKTAGRTREPVASVKAPVRTTSVGPADANARRALGRRLLMLVRPDGYVGLTARVDDANALDGYLDAFVEPGR